MLALHEVSHKSHDSIVSFVSDSWQNRNQHRAGIESDWYTDVAQYLGYQYHTYDGFSGQLRTPRAPPWRVRLVANRLLPIARKMVAKALSQRPKWVCVPATGDINDQAISLVSSKVLDYYWRSEEMDTKLIELFYWVAITGNGFLSVVWDPMKGEKIRLEESDLESQPKEIKKSPLAKKAVKEGLHMGDLEFCVHSPFEIDFNPGATRMREVTYLVHSRAMSASDLAERYDVNEEELKADAEDGSIKQFYERRIQGLAGRSGTANAGGTDMVLTHALWVRPNKQNPNGMYALVANDKVLQSVDAIPNPFQEIPFVHLTEIPVPGRFWGTSSLHQCIPLQADYNRGRSQMVENRNLMSRPKWLVPSTAGLLSQNLTDQPGEVVEYTPGLKPEAWTPPPLPDYVRQTLDNAIRDMDDVSSFHDVSQGKSPGGGVRAGVAIATLQEQDDQMLAPTFLLAEKELSKVGSWALELLADNVTEERVVKIVGENRDVEAMTFTGSELLGDSDGVSYFDVEVQIGSQLPASKSARLQFMVELIQNGVLDPVNKPEDKAMILKIIELGSTEGNLSDSQLDRQEARRENVMMVNGTQVVPMDWHDHAIHIEELDRFRKQPKYRKLIDQQPEIEEVFEEHKQAHVLGLTQNMLAQQPPPGMQAEETPQPEPEEALSGETL